MSRLPNEQQFRLVHQRLEMPFIFKERSFYNTYYEIDGSEPGEYQFMASGLGNTHIQKKFATLSKNHVIGMMHLNYIAIKPVIGAHGSTVGTHLTQI